MNRLLTPEDVAERTQLCVATVRRLCRDGELPAKKIGRSWRIVEHRFMAWLEDSEPSDKVVALPVKQHAADNRTRGWRR